MSGRVHPTDQQTACAKVIDLSEAFAGEIPLRSRVVERLQFAQKTIPVFIIKRISRPSFKVSAPTQIRNDACL
jgi:hypothetical protein